MSFAQAYINMSSPFVRTRQTFSRFTLPGCSSLECVPGYRYKANTSGLIELIACPRSESLTRAFGSHPLPAAVTLKVLGSADHGFERHSPGSHLVDAIDTCRQRYVTRLRLYQWILVLMIAVEPR